MAFNYVTAVRNIFGGGNDKPQGHSRGALINTLRPAQKQTQAARVAARTWVKGLVVNPVTGQLFLNDVTIEE